MYKCMLVDRAAVLCSCVRVGALFTSTSQTFQMSLTLDGVQSNEQRREWASGLLGSGPVKSLV